MIPTPVCPSCGGPWLYSLTFRHEPRCPLYSIDDGRADADHEVRSGQRPATATELQFVQALGFDPGDYTIRFNHWGFHRRAVYIGGALAYRPSNERDAELLSLYQPITETETFYVHDPALGTHRVLVQQADGTRRPAQRL